MIPWCIRTWYFTAVFVFVIADDGSDILTTTSIATLMAKRGLFNLWRNRRNRFVEVHAAKPSLVQHLVL